MKLFDEVIPNYDSKRLGFVRPATNLVETWLNARFTYCFSKETIKNPKKYKHLAALGIQTLNETLWDDTYLGWFDNDSKSTNKSAYPHAFVLLAAATAAQAEIPESQSTFEKATMVILNHFWEPEFNATKESFSRDWSTEEPYRGANSSMHMTEAFIAAYDLTNDLTWLEKAFAITKRITSASENFDFRIPEHFNKNWQVEPNYNIENKTDQFRPYGVIPGHGFEWSRLCLELASRTQHNQSWLTETAKKLYERAKADSFHNNGFHYTTDLQGNPIITLRMHWVVCEAISAAAAFSFKNSDSEYKEDLVKFIKIAKDNFIKKDYWIHELDENDQPSKQIWQDNPDIYHAYTAIELSKAAGVPINA